MGEVPVALESVCVQPTQDVRESFKLCIPCYLVEGDYFIV